MPYRVVRGTGRRPWKIKRNGVTVGTATSRANAEASIRAREANEHKSKGRGGKVPRSPAARFLK